MKFTDSKISLDKSWKFTPQVLILIILGIFVNLVFSVSIWYSLKTISPLPPLTIQPPALPSPEEQIAKYVPSENLFAVNAKIVEISTEENTLLVKAIIPTGWDKEWKLFLSDETILTTFLSWQEAGKTIPTSLEEGLSAEEQDKLFKEALKKLTLSGFKVDDIIYLISNDDLAKEYEIRDIQAILLQEIK